MTVNINDVNDITIVDYPHKGNQSISKQLRNIRAEQTEQRRYP